MTAQFTVSEHSLTEFAKASGDLNPLHTSEIYARHSPFGRPIVHGSLGLLTACASSGVDLSSISQVSAQFLAPLYPGIPYSVTALGSNNSINLSVSDGKRSVFKAELRVGQDRQVLVQGEQPTFPITGPNTTLPPSGDDVHIGPYWPDVPRIKTLFKALDATQVPDWLIMEVAAVSFTVGMVLPGERALLRSFCVNRPMSIEGPAHIRLAIPSPLSLSRGIARIEGTVSGSTEAWSFSAAASIRAINIAPKAPTRDPSLAGKSALVVGASRGLGAAIRNELIARGCRTWALQRTPSPTQLHPLESTITGDATDQNHLGHVRRTVMADSGGLDLLVLNATSALQAMWLDEAHLDRLTHYVQHEIRLMLTPLTILASTIRPGGVCAFLSSQIFGSTKNEGISSDATEWPHYAAAKAAGESLMEVASLEYPSVRFVVSRLPLLDTQLTLRTTVSPGTRSDVVAADLISAWTSGYSSRYDITTRSPFEGAQ